MRVNPAWRGPFCFATAFLWPLALRAENLNVSEIATSGRHINWRAEAITLGTYGGANITYFEMGRARVEGDTSNYFAPGPWSAAWANSIQYPYVERAVSTPGPEYASPFYRRALVNMGASPKLVKSQTFETGWAQAAVNYSVRIEHFWTTPLEYFVRLNHPKLMRSISPGLHITPGGNQPIDEPPEAARSRAAIDVFVDGLPIWSTETTYMYPAGHANNATDKVETKWGKTVVADGETKLYLGRLTAGKSITITLIVRTDAHATAPQCGQARYNQFSPYITYCFDLQESVQLTSASGPVSFSVYAKQLNTTPF